MRAARALPALLVALASLASCHGPATPQSSPPPAARLVLDSAHDYGDRYAEGLLPVGDGRYRTDAPAKGYVFACAGYAQSLGSGQGGAQERGPWFHGGSYDARAKPKVSGSVPWTASFSDVVRGGTRTITTDDLPSHPTGTFPIQPSDPAYQYDRNPNAIRSQSLSYSLPAAPAYGAPSCMGGEAGILTTGVALFNGFDAGGRDAGAWEVQDGCSGHPQRSGEYHYHTLSPCIADVSVRSVIGFALDGFPITGPRLAAHDLLTTRDLDECHGITSPVVLAGKQVTTYHYVMTQDFPYSVSCFRGSATQPPGRP
jgi:hypothetical protein